MTTPRTSYPPGVTCFIDTERADVDAALAFYGGLFGWSFEERMPPGQPGRFSMAKIDGLSVAAIASASGGAAPAWNTYVSVESADATVSRVEAAGGTLLLEPLSFGEAGRMAVFADPEGAAFRVWEPHANPGAQLVNAPGAWNWSDLETRDPDAAKAFYGAVFGWEFRAQDFGDGPMTLICVPGYGEFLETLAPGTLAAMDEVGAPEGFADAIGWMYPPAQEDTPANWAVTFSVADADASARRAVELGATVVTEPFDAPWVRVAVLRDPDGVTFTIGQFKPPA